MILKVFGEVDDPSRRPMGWGIARSAWIEPIPLGLPMGVQGCGSEGVSQELLNRVQHFHAARILVRSGEHRNVTRF